jgi:predicted RNase H-like HicB family nuclease
VTIERDTVARCFVAHCPSLDIYSAGRTRDAAERAIASAIAMFERICRARGIQVPS